MAVTSVVVVVATLVLLAASHNYHHHHPQNQHQQWQWGGDSSPLIPDTVFEMSPKILLSDVPRSHLIFSDRDLMELSVLLRVSILYPPNDIPKDTMFASCPVLYDGFSSHVTGGLQDFFFGCNSEDTDIFMSIFFLLLVSVAFQAIVGSKKGHLGKGRPPLPPALCPHASKAHPPVHFWFGF